MVKRPSSEAPSPLDNKNSSAQLPPGTDELSVQEGECSVGHTTLPPVQSQLETNTRQSAGADSTSLPSTSPSISQDSVIFPGNVVGGVLPRDQESTVVTLGLAGVNEECMAISVPQSTKVNNLTMESGLCTVNQDGSTRLLVHNTQSSPRRFIHGTYLVDCEGLPTAVGVINALSSVPSAHNNTLDTPEHESKVRAAVPSYSKTTDYPHEADGLEKFLTKYHAVVWLPGDPLGSTNAIKHEIPLKDDAAPVFIQAYRHPDARRAVIDRLVKDVLAQYVIEPSKSPWNFPLFLLSKKDGSYRPVVDYRKLNKLCKQERFPQPVLQDILMSIGLENSVFTTLDLVSGYWQVPLTEESKKYTTFSTPRGHYAFKKMPFGISGAALIFQRLSNLVFSGLTGDSVFTFLDDVIIASKDVEAHLQKLEEVLDRLKLAGLSLQLTKCNFMKKHIAFLGHVLDAEGINTTPEKESAVQISPPPKDLKSLR